MSIRNAIASVAVKDLKISLPWYEKLLGRGPDRADQEGLAEWIFEQGGRLQLRQLPARAGRGSLTLRWEVWTRKCCNSTGGESVPAM